jgi:hypothetical protein
LDSFLVFIAVSSTVYFMFKKGEDDVLLKESHTPPQSFRDWKNLAERIVSFFSKEEFADYKAIQQFCQSHFLRPQGCERGSVEEKKYFDSLFAQLDRDQKQGLWDLFKKNGFVADVLPPKKVYDKVLILGGSFHRMQKRVHFLDQLVSLRKVYLSEDCSISFLVGDRLLYSSEFKDPLLFPKERVGVIDRSKCEADLPGMVWGHSVRGPILRRHTYNILRVDKKKGDDRARTADTIEVFLDKTKGALGNVLIISSNPFVAYQGLTTKTLFMQKGLPIDTVDVVGPNELDSSMTNESLGRVLDSFVRAFYQKLQLEEVRCLEKHEQV